MVSKRNSIAAMLLALLCTLAVLTGCTSTEASTENGNSEIASGTQQNADNTDYDEMFTDINQALFTEWAAEGIDEDGNYFRRASIDVVDTDGYDHQATVYVCDGSEEFTQAYRDYLKQLVEIYGEDMGEIAGYRNAATNGDRTYRETEIDFFCIQEVSFTDRDGTGRNGVVVVVDGTEEYAGQEDNAYNAFYEAYTD